MATAVATRPQTITIRQPRAIARPRRRAKTGITIPMGIVAGFAPVTMQTIREIKSGVGIDNAAIDFLTAMTGINFYGGGLTNTAFLRIGLIPVLSGIAVHKFIGGSLGINKMLARYHVPVIRL